MGQHDDYEAIEHSLKINILFKTINFQKNKEASSVLAGNSIAEKCNDAKKAPKDFPLQDEFCCDKVQLENGDDDDDIPFEEILQESNFKEEVKEESVKNL